jgi:HAD superfamily hydrolase (TIGR01549 family)
MMEEIKTSVLPRAILFDMDGTLTQPVLDFALIKLEMAIGPGPILENLRALEGSRKREAEAVLHRHEKAAAENSELNDGCTELLSWLAENGLATGLVTRNSPLSAETVLRRHGLAMSVIITREELPFKPSPAPLRLACDRLGIGLEDTWMVGDGQHDIEAACAAGMRSVWISHGKKRTFEAEPWAVVADLRELNLILEGLKKPTRKR